MCPYLMEQGNLDPWVQFFKAILDMDTPAEIKPQVDDVDEINKREKNIFWKLKGITAKLTYRIFVKYGNPTIVEEKPHIQEFSKWFSTNCNVPLLESHLTILLSKGDNYVGAKTLNFAIKYTSASTKLKNTMEKLKPFIDKILKDIVIPILFVS